jgi:hypothetical protein
MVVAIIAMPFAVFMIGISAAVVEATGRREETQVLLRELEATNADLKQLAAKIRELSVSEERSRMAREIHDSVGHHLTAINLQLQNARRFKERKPDAAWQEVEEARVLALEALSPLGGQALRARAKAAGRRGSEQGTRPRRRSPATPKGLGSRSPLRPRERSEISPAKRNSSCTAQCRRA